jgi:DNA polymerase-3 subunit epsilon
VQVHGITAEFLAGQPRFEDVAVEWLDFVRGSELVIHNAPFDVAFLDAELARLAQAAGRVGDFCAVLDTLALARQLHPGQRNSLDALCKRYSVDNSQRDLHGALLDADLLLEVYLAMTGGQGALTLESSEGAASANAPVRRAQRPPGTLAVVRATAAEVEAHEGRLAALDRSSGGRTVWRRLDWPT